MTPEEVEAQLTGLRQQHGLEGGFEDFSPDDEEFVAGDADEIVFTDDAEDVGGESLLGLLFRPIDGLFMLFAFFTAYKVGAGQADD